MISINLSVNSHSIAAELDERMLLVDFLRDRLGLTGTHVSCDTSQCGACIVHVDGVARKACTTFAWQVQGAHVTTIEGIGTADDLHPMQDAFRVHHGLQCGFCTPGMIMSGIDLVRRRGHDLSDELIRHELEGNLCRCTGYHNIVRAIADGARMMKETKPMADRDS